jgi:Large polyvalent protein associated domain 29
MATHEYISTKDVARIIRGELRREFPGLKVSVRTAQYSMGSHVSVSWTDGPTTRQVDAVIGRFCGTTFDGSDDSTHHHDSVWEGRRVRFMGSAPSTTRTVTREAERVQEARTLLESRLAIEGTGPQARWGNDWVDNLASGLVYASDFRAANPLERAWRVVILRERD